MSWLHIIEPSTHLEDDASYFFWNFAWQAFTHIFTCLKFRTDGLPYLPFEPNGDLQGGDWPMEAAASIAVVEDSYNPELHPDNQLGLLSTPVPQHNILFQIWVDNAMTFRHCQWFCPVSFREPQERASWVTSIGTMCAPERLSFSPAAPWLIAVECLPPDMDDI